MVNVCHGRQLADQARETQPDLKVLFITGYAVAMASRPASTLVQVAALTPASARVEIEVTAVVHD